ncbi:hypothetical protein D3C83_138190 [compost metagenome]
MSEAAIFGASLVPVTVKRPRHSLSRPRPRTKMRPGTSIAMSSAAGSAAGLGLPLAARLGPPRGGGRFGARLWISTTCSLVTLGGR